MLLRSSGGLLPAGEWSTPISGAASFILVSSVRDRSLCQSGVHWTGLHWSVDRRLAGTVTAKLTVSEMLDVLHDMASCNRASQQ